jgi:hypothetical protein
MSCPRPAAASAATHHLRVVRTAPGLRVDVVEPPVERGDEVAPLQDPQRPSELLVPVLRRPERDAPLAEASIHENHPGPGPLDEVAPRELVELRYVDALLVSHGMPPFLRAF